MRRYYQLPIWVVLSVLVIPVSLNFAAVLNKDAVMKAKRVPVLADQLADPRAGFLPKLSPTWPDKPIGRPLSSQTTTDPNALTSSLAQSAPLAATHYADGNRGIVAIQPLRQRTSNRLAASRAAILDPNAMVLNYLEDNSHLLGIRAPRRHLVMNHLIRDSLGMYHVHYQQQLDTIPVWGRQLTAHVDATGDISWINCLLARTFSEDPNTRNLKPTLSASQARAMAGVSLAARNIKPRLPAQQARALKLEDQTELFYWQMQPEDPLRLVWVVEVHPNLRDRWRFFIDAHTGNILHAYNAVTINGPQTASGVTRAGAPVTLHTYLMSPTYYLLDASRPMFVPGQSDAQLRNDPRGVIYALDARNHDLTSQTSLYSVTSSHNTWSDTTANSAMDYAAQTYDFYYNLPNYGRNSYDHNGASILLVLHATEEGQSMENAYWNGSMVVLGDGGSSFYPLAGARDVVAHELTHAVVEYTANLEYQFQSGALNETYADIGGLCVDAEDYLVGEDAVKLAGYPSGALRNMSDPHNGGTADDYYWQPATMAEYQDMPIQYDNGGVHKNSGITNFVAYKIFDALGSAVAQQILFRTLENYLTSQSNFTDFRLGTLQAATDIYGADSAEVTSVRSAFDDVGITAEGGTTPPDDRPPVEGSHYVAFVNDVTSGLFTDNSLWVDGPFTDLSQITGGHAITTTQVNIGSGRPLAVDHYGQFIYFVDAQFNLRAIVPNGADEQILSDAGEWWSVAISPSGNRLAMTRNATENIIWFFDLAAGSAPTSLTLYHPTTAQGGTYADIVQYADSLVFVDEDSLAYDCYNVIQSPGSGEITFWDVNVINVINGIIQPLLPPQTDVSIGNPIVATTNKSVMVVEKNSQNNHQIIGVDRITGETQIIRNGGPDFTYPDYSPNDAYLIYSHGSPGNIYTLSLNDDKISTSGVENILIAEGQQPLWFVVGEVPTYSLTAAVVGDYGTVTPAAGTYDFGTNVTLTASPDIGYQVASWNGTNDDSSTAATNTVLMDDNKNVTVEFEGTTGALTITKCTVQPSGTADAQQGLGSFMVNGSMTSAPTTLGMSTVTINFGPYSEILGYANFRQSGSKYTYKGSSGHITALTLDLAHATFSITARNVNLEGLTNPIHIEVVIGGYLGATDYEHPALSLLFLKGIDDALDISHLSVGFNRDYTAATIRVTAALAAADLDVDLTETELTISFNGQDITLPAGSFVASRSPRKFTYKSPSGTQTNVLSVVLDLQKATLVLTITKCPLTFESGEMIVGLEFGDFAETDSWPLSL